MERGNEWTAQVAAGVGQRVAYFRGRRKLTAKALADRCAELGLPLGRPTISKLEKGLRQTVTVDEVQVLAKALDVAPIKLLFPLDAKTVEVLPGQCIDTLDAILWFTDDGDASDIALFKKHRALMAAWPAGQSGPVPTGIMSGSMTDEDQQRWRTAVGVQQQVRQTRALIRERGLTPPRLKPGLEWIDNEAPGG